jgi:hypothetical protein
MHDFGTRGAAVAVRGGIIRVGLDLDDSAGHAVHVEDTADEFGCDLEGGTGEKRSLEEPGQNFARLTKEAKLSIIKVFQIFKPL